MLAELPQRQNWQIAFLNAFHASFQSPWILKSGGLWQLVHFTAGICSPPNLAFEESCKKLDAAVHCPGGDPRGNQRNALHASVTLQTVIQDWDSARQANCLEAKIRELELLRPRLGREFAGLVTVGQTLQTIAASTQNGSDSILRPKGGARSSRGQALKQLDDLDTQRASVRPAPKASDRAAALRR